VQLAHLDVERRRWRAWAISLARGHRERIDPIHGIPPERKGLIMQMKMQVLQKVKVKLKVLI
jgi:hypothetical protein